jgi:hypothetical protein
MSNADDIGKELRAALGAGDDVLSLASQHYADEIQIAHRPPVPSDGPKARDEAIAAKDGASKMLSSAIPELARSGVVAVNGDDVELTLVLTGTGKDGVAFKAQQELKYTVSDGKIVAVESHVDPEQMAALAKAIGGLPHAE